jgi:hypothetical protein
LHINISIATPVVSALRNQKPKTITIASRASYEWRVEFPTGILNHFLIQVAVSLPKPFRSNGHFKPLLDPGDRFTSETVSDAKRLLLQIQNCNGHYATVSEAKRLQVYDVYMKQPFPNGHKRPFGCNGYMAKWPFAKASGFI